MKIKTTEIEITELLNHIPEGRKNAVHMQPLAAKLGITDRMLRQRVHDARLAGHLIISCMDGYYRPDRGSEDTESELKHFYHARRKSGIGTLATLKATREHLQMMEGK